MLYLSDYKTKQKDIMKHTLIDSCTLQWREVTAKDCYELIKSGTEIEFVELVGNDVPQYFTIRDEIAHDVDYVTGLIYSNGGMFLPKEYIFQGSSWTIYRCNREYYFKSENACFMTISPNSQATGMTYILEDDGYLVIGYGIVRYSLSTDGSYKTYTHSYVCADEFDCIKKADISYKTFLRERVTGGIL